MDRKKFFTKISLALAGLLAVSGNPLKFFKVKTDEKASPVKIKINELAVKRDNTGLKNV